MEEGPIFSGELVYSLLEGREGEAACGDRETRARAIFISRRAKWKRHRAFRAPRVSQLRGSCWLRRRGEGKQFSLSLSRKISNFIPRREMKEEEEEEEKEREKGRRVFRVGRLFELKRIKGGKKFRESIRIGSIRGESIRLESPKISIRGRKRIYPDRKSLTSHESRFVSWIDLAEKVDGIDLTNFINVCRSLSVSRARNTRAERGGGGGGGDPLAAESR